jgi:hypothetical protein
MKEQVISYIGMGVLLALIVRYPRALSDGLVAVSRGASDIIGGGIGGIIRGGAVG